MELASEFGFRVHRLAGGERTVYALIVVGKGDFDWCSEQIFNSFDVDGGTLLAPIQHQFNPVLQIIGLMRGGIYAAYNDSYVSIVYIVLLSATLIAVSGHFIRMEQSRLIQQ